MLGHAKGLTAVEEQDKTNLVPTVSPTPWHEEMHLLESSLTVDLGPVDAQKSYIFPDQVVELMDGRDRPSFVSAFVNKKAILGGDRRWPRLRYLHLDCNVHECVPLFRVDIDSRRRSSKTGCSRRSGLEARGRGQSF